VSLRGALIGETDGRVLVLGLARMVEAVGNSFLIVVLPLYIVSGAVDLGSLLGSTLAVGPLSVSLTEPLLIGVVLSLFGFLNSLSQPLTGRLSDRIGARKPFILAGVALLGTASGLYVLATEYWMLVALRLLQGLSAALTIPATVALVNEYATSSSERGGSFGVFNTFRLLGFGTGPIAAGAVVEAGPYAVGSLTLSGFDAAFAIACVGAYLSVLLVLVFVDDPEDLGDTQAGDDVAVSVRGTDRLLDPVFTLGVATVVMGICIALFATLQGQINERLGQPPVWFGAQFAAVTIANVLLQVPIGRACDEYGRRPFLVAGFLLLVPATILQGIVTTPLTMVLVRLLQGVAVAFVFAPSLALAGDLAGKNQSGSTLSVLTMGFGLGVAIGPLASGWLVSFGFATPFVVGGALAVVALVAVTTQVQETLVTEEPQPAPGD
jgi:MFS family permease